MGLENLAISYETTVTQRQFYRIITATFTHLNLLHVGFNVAALYGLGGEWEALNGTPWYLQTTVGFVILAGFLDLLIIRVGAIKYPEWLQVRCNASAPWDNIWHAERDDPDRLAQ